MKKSKNAKILTPEQKKRRNRKILTVVFICLFTPILCFGIAVGAFALWAQNQKPDANLLPTATAAPVFFDTDGNQLPYVEENYIDPDDIPQNLKNAFVALEDKRFYSHKGYDPIRIAGAFLNNIKSKSLKEGASTITQQLVKNTHLTHEKTVSRKLKEIAIASNIEKEYSKDEILAMYLSVIYFGNGAYGAKQAARLYFDKDINDLSLSECASLAGTVKNPKKYSPFSEESDSIQRRNLVLKVMQKEGYIDLDACSRAQSAPLNVAERKTDNLNKRIYDLYIKNAISEACEKLDITKYELSNSALKIYLNVDSALQTKIAAIGADESLYSNDKINGAIIVLDNSAHAVSAYWSNLPYDVKRQAGSVLKPLAVYAPAIDMNACTLATPIVDEKVTYGDFSPSNYGGKYYGETTIRQAIKKSMNSVSVKTMSYIGVDSSVDYLSRLGISTLDSDKNYALSLGALTDGVSVKSIAQAYSTFANQGVYAPSNFIKYIVKDGRKIVDFQSQISTRVVKPSTCDQINSALSDTVKDGTAITLSALDFEVCAKTGTAQRSDAQNGDAWCASYNDDCTIVVWHGSDDGMGEKGGGFATMQCLKSWQSASKIKPMRKSVSRSNDSIVLDVDLYATKRNKQVTIASDFTPIEYRKPEIFSVDSTYPMSSCFDSISQDKIDFSISKSQGAISVSISAEEIYSYKITRIDPLGETLISIIDGKSALGGISISDTPPIPYGVIVYKVECYITANPTISVILQKEIYFDDFS